MNKKITMKDIAKELNLSINSVSLALNDRVGVSDQTKRNILKKAEELGYLERNTKYTHTYSGKNICVLVKKKYFHDMHFYGKILLGIEEQAHKKGFDVLINSYEENNIVPSCIENHMVAGIIVVGKIEDTFLIHLKLYSIPIVLVDHTSLLESTDSILTDNKLGTYNATVYLYERGFRKIGFFGDLDYTLSVQERYWGYKEAIKILLGFHDKEKIQTYIETHSVLENLEHNVIENNTEKIVEIVRTIKEIPEAFICSNDHAAIQLSNALKIIGYQLPDDISIIGFDDIDLARIVIPKLTTVKVNKILMGKKAIDCLIRKIEHKNELIEKIIMDVAIVERDSVKIKIQ